MYKIAVMGDWDSIYGFAALGLTPVVVTDGKQGTKKLQSLAELGYGIIYITEALAAEMTKAIDAYRDQGLPAVILIPGVTGNTGWGLRAVRQSIERAVDSNILLESES